MEYDSFIAGKGAGGKGGDVSRQPRGYATLPVIDGPKPLQTEPANFPVVRLARRIEI